MRHWQPQTDRRTGKDRLGFVLQNNHDNVHGSQAVLRGKPLIHRLSLCD
jgi:hypothetical protein